MTLGYGTDNCSRPRARLRDSGAACAWAAGAAGAGARRGAGRARLSAADRGAARRGADARRADWLDAQGCGRAIDDAGAVRRRPGAIAGVRLRSEEHTSELQSLMRISYAVFCLKKKTTYSHNHYT